MIMKKGKIKSKKSQVWIETVIYTLIALTIIGIVLGIIKPALEEQKDKAAIRQSIDSLNEIDSKINNIKYIPGNSRSLELKITRGNLIIDGEEDKIKIIIEDSNYAPSEPGLVVNEGNVAENTTEKGKKYQVTMTLDYSNKMNITYRGKDEQKTFQYAPVAYKLSVINNGGSIFNIDFF